MRRLLIEVMDRIELELLLLIAMCAVMAASRLSAAAWAAEGACEECGGRVDSIESVRAQRGVGCDERVEEVGPRSHETCAQQHPDG